MLLKLILLFTILPAAELYLLIKIGQVIGAWETVLLMILMGVLGAALARNQGLAVIRKFQEAASRGQMPADQILDGLLVMAGGALLVTPGALTDIMGVILVAPFTRKYFREYIKQRIAQEMKGGGSIHFYSMGPRPSSGPHSQRNADDVRDV